MYKSRVITITIQENVETVDEQGRVTGPYSTIGYSLWHKSSQYGRYTILPEPVPDAETVALVVGDLVADAMSTLRELESHQQAISPDEKE